MENKVESKNCIENITTKSFDLADDENKQNRVVIEVKEFSENEEDYFYQINYVFDKEPLFIPQEYKASLPIYKNILTENLVEFLLMDYDLLEYYIPTNKLPSAYKREIINCLYSLCN
jgi:hypothetical protein